MAKKKEPITDTSGLRAVQHRAYSYTTKAGKHVTVPAHVEFISTTRAAKAKAPSRAGVPGYHAVHHQAYSYVTKKGKRVTVPAHTEYVKTIPRMVGFGL